MNTDLPSHPHFSMNSSGPSGEHFALDTGTPGQASGLTRVELPSAPSPSLAIASTAAVGPVSGHAGAAPTSKSAEAIFQLKTRSALPWVMSLASSSETPAASSTSSVVDWDSGHVVSVCG